MRLKLKRDIKKIRRRHRTFFLHSTLLLSSPRHQSINQSRSLHCYFSPPSFKATKLGRRIGRPNSVHFYDQKERHLATPTVDEVSIKTGGNTSSLNKKCSVCSSFTLKLVVIFEQKLLCHCTNRFSVGRRCEK